LLETFDPLLIFVELKGPRLDGLAFTRLLRRSYLHCREAAVIVTTAEATAAAIMGARDAGVHEFLRRPFNLGDLKKRFDAIVVRPRDWIEAVNYVGPDRRRFNSADYKGPRKRLSEGAAPIIQQMGQASRIVQSAALATSSDPKQALRALKAQMRILIQLSAGKEALKPLQTVALAFERYLLDSAQTNGLSKDQVESFAAQLILATPAAAADRAA
jgi:DNA-binding response OmpR family regulator